MEEDKVYVGAVGLEIIVDVGVAIAGYQDYTYRVLRPGESAEVTWSGLTGHDATSFKYVTVADDLNNPGTYKLQVRLTNSTTGWIGRSNTVEFEVYAHFE